MESPSSSSIPTVALMLSHDDIFGSHQQKHETLHSAVHGISILYGVLLSLLGFVVPLSEAVQHQWLSTTYGAIFIMYTYVVGTVFVIYSEVINFRCSNFRQTYPTTVRQLSDVKELPVKIPTMANQDTVSHNMQGVAEECIVRFRANGINKTDQLAPSFSSPSDITHVWSKSAASHFHPHPHQLFSSTVAEPEYTKSTARSTNDDDAINICVDLAKLKKIFETQETSAYLRFALLLFAVGNIVYVIIEIHNYVSEVINDCNPDKFGWTYFIRLIFTVCQTLFFFRGTQVQWKAQVPVVRLGLTHLIATNLGVWIRTMINEMEHVLEERNDLMSNTTKNSTTGHEKGDICMKLNEFLMALSPYLFPFVMEYSLIVLGLSAIMYGAIHSERVSSFQNLKYLLFLRRKADDGSEKSERNTSSDTRSVDSVTIKNSNIGAFLGGLMFTGMMVCLIATAVQQQYDEEKASITYLITEVILNSILLIACIVASKKIRHLPRIDREASVDDFLLLIAMGGTFLLHLSIIMPLASNIMDNGSTLLLSLSLAGCLLAMCQTLMQTLILLAAMRAYSPCIEHAQAYPARQVFTFLVFSNASLWIFHMAMWQQLQVGFQQNSTLIVWLFLLHLNLPFLLFYHFHSSVCFADAWHSAYQPLTHRLKSCLIANYNSQRYEMDCIAMQSRL